MSDEPYFDPSDAVDIPDDAEPWENRPDAVCDQLIHEDIVPWVLRRWGHDGAVQIAHAILSEVEIAQKGDG